MPEPRSRLRFQLITLADVRALVRALVDPCSPLSVPTLHTRRSEVLWRRDDAGNKFTARRRPTGPWDTWEPPWPDERLPHVRELLVAGRMDDADKERERRGAVNELVQSISSLGHVLLGVDQRDQARFPPPDSIRSDSVQLHLLLQRRQRVGGKGDPEGLIQRDHAVARIAADLRQGGRGEVILHAPAEPDQQAVSRQEEEEDHERVANGTSHVRTAATAARARQQRAAFTRGRPGRYKAEHLDMDCVAAAGITNIAFADPGHVTTLQAVRLRFEAWQQLEGKIPLQPGAFNRDRVPYTQIAYSPAEATFWSTSPAAMALQRDGRLSGLLRLHGWAVQELGKSSDRQTGTTTSAAVSLLAAVLLDTAGSEARAGFFAAAREAAGHALAGWRSQPAPPSSACRAAAAAAASSAVDRLFIATAEAAAARHLGVAVAHLHTAQGRLPAAVIAQAQGLLKPLVYEPSVTAALEHVGSCGSADRAGPTAGGGDELRVEHISTSRRSYYGATHAHQHRQRADEEYADLLAKRDASQRRLQAAVERGDDAGARAARKAVSRYTKTLRRRGYVPDGVRALRDRLRQLSQSRRTTPAGAADDARERLRLKLDPDGLWRFTGSKTQAHLRFRRQQLEDAGLHDLLRQHCPDKNDVLVCGHWGWTAAGGRARRGTQHGPTPCKKTLRFLARFRRVIEIREDYTSCRCPLCREAAAALRMTHPFTRKALRSKHELERTREWVEAQRRRSQALGGGNTAEAEAAPDPPNVSPYRPPGEVRGTSHCALCGRKFARDAAATVNMSYLFFHMATHDGKRPVHLTRGENTASGSG